MVKKYLTKKEVKQLELMEVLLENSDMFKSFNTTIDNLTIKVVELSLEVGEIKKAFNDVVEENKQLIKTNQEQVKKIALLQQGHNASQILTEYFYGAVK